MTARPLGLFLLGCATLATGCGQDPLCPAGATQACHCAGGMPGVQGCAGDGAKWEPCQCEPGGGSGPGAAADGEGEGEAEAGSAGESGAASEGEGEGEATGESEGEATGEGEGEAPTGGEGEGGEGPGGVEACNGLDDDHDGDTDEVDVVVEHLDVEFDPLTAVDPDHASIEVMSGDGTPVEGSPFTGAALSGATVQVPGGVVVIRLVADAQSLSLFGYRVTRIADQTGREAPGPLPESPHSEDSHDHTPDLEDSQRYAMADSLGTGLTCGTDEGACSAGVTSCLAGRVLCAGEGRPSQETCNGLDDDCDGATDEVEDLVDAPPCALSEGVCEGALQPCGGVAGYQPCNSNTYGPEYEVLETRCDCQDNDVVDGAVGAAPEDPTTTLACPLDALAAEGANRDCVVQANSTALATAYQFRTLTVPANVTLDAPPGQCLTLRADALEIAGHILLAPTDAASCDTGDPAGSLHLAGERIVVSGQLRSETQGGAGAKLVLRARHLEVSGAITRTGVAAGEGTSDRSLELTGGLILAEGSVVSSRSGDGQPAGHVRLGGPASLARDRVVGGSVEVAEIAGWLRGRNGQSTAAAVRIEFEGDGALVAETTAGDDGWAIVAAALQPDVRTRFVVTDTPSLNGGTVLFAYGDPLTEGSCILDAGLLGDPPSAVLPAIMDCE